MIHHHVLSAYLCVVAMLFLMPLIIHGDQWQVLTVEDGLLDNGISALFQSEDGCIWIGSYDLAATGVCRYDNGVITQHTEYERVGTPPVWWWPGPHRIRRISECCGTIWIAHQGGLSALVDGLWRRMIASTLIFSVRAGLMATQGETLVAAWAWHGVVINPCDDEGWITILESNLDARPQRYITEAFPDSHGRIWCDAIGMGGTLVIDYEGEVLEEYPYGNVDYAEDAEGRIWAAGRGLYVNDGTTFVPVPAPLIPDVWWWDIEFSADDDLMVIVCRDAACILDGEDWSVNWHDDTLPGRPQCALVDRDNNIWVGTENGLAVLWREAPPPMPIFLGIEVDGDEYRGGDSMTASLDLLNSMDRTVDLYVALETPGGELLFYPGFGTSWSCFLSGLHIEAETAVENYQLFSLTLPDLPAGTYRWFAACTHAGTMDFASNIASCEWEFE